MYIEKQQGWRIGYTKHGHGRFITLTDELVQHLVLELQQHGPELSQSSDKSD